MSSSDDDGQQHFVLGFLFALIFLVITFVTSVAVFKRGAAPAPAAVATVAAAAQGSAPAPEASAPATEASVVVQQDIVKFYFATGKTELAADATQALTEISKAAMAGRKIAISGFHDASGNLAMNQELAKKRAFAVRDALKSLGVAEDAIELKKPEQTEAEGSNAEARRVEVTLLP